AEPGVQPLRVAKAAEAAQRGADGIVGRLLGVAAVAHDREGEPVPAVEVAFQLLGEGTPGARKVVALDATRTGAATRHLVRASVDHCVPLVVSAGRQRITAHAGYDAGARWRVHSEEKVASAPPLSQVGRSRSSAVAR